MCFVFVLWTSVFKMKFRQLLHSRPVSMVVVGVAQNCDSEDQGFDPHNQCMTLMPNCVQCGSVIIHGWLMWGSSQERGGHPGLAKGTGHVNRVPGVSSPAWKAKLSSWWLILDKAQCLVQLSLTASSCPFWRKETEIVNPRALVSCTDHCNVTYSCQKQRQ